MKIVTIVGARPQFIKAAVVSREISNYNQKLKSSEKSIDETIVHTGQHYDDNMSAVFFDELSIPEPHLNLGVGSGSHGEQTGQMLIKIEEVLMQEKPDWVLVYGDTNSTLAGALAGVKLNIPVAHVEAGLRSFNRKMPEEINRLVTDHVATLLFCPTQRSVENLREEGMGEDKIALVGDVMYDAALRYEQFAKKPSFDLPPEFVLATIHRAENTDDVSRLDSIFRAMEKISQKIPVILPLHPRTQKRIKELDISNPNTGLNIQDPVSYLKMIYLLKNCNLVMTDSGGLQKEAFFFKKPCIILREDTEWVELIEHEYNLLAGTEAEKIYFAFTELRNSHYSYNTPFYGDGKAGEKIVDILVSC